MNSLIRTACQQYIIRTSGGYRRFVERECYMRWQKGVCWEVSSSALPVIAYIVRSDWIADCGVCKESLVVEPGEPFFCPNCMNALHGGKARIVQWPEQYIRERVESILTARIIPETRNWNPEESVESLLAENLIHGEGVGI